MSAPEHPATLPERQSLHHDHPFTHALNYVDRIAAAGRSRAEAIERVASHARHLPGLLFGITLAVCGLVLLGLAALRGSVEVTGAIFDSPKPWVAWTVIGGILLIVALLVGSVRNRGGESPPST